jgi:hypothetical protein
MKSTITVLLFCFFLLGCDYDQRPEVTNSIADKKIETDFPLLIEDGSKLVYQFGHLTADKGLKLYYDTMLYQAGGLRLPDSIKLRLSVQKVDVER